MTIQQMKDAIAAVYDTTSWKKKVENMYDDQVVAIYYNFSNRGILDKTLRKERPKHNTLITPTEAKQPEGQQVSIFDLINE